MRMIVTRLVSYSLTMCVVFVDLCSVLFGIVCGALSSLGSSPFFLYILLIKTHSLLIKTPFFLKKNNFLLIKTEFLFSISKFNLSAKNVYDECQSIQPGLCRIKKQFG